MRRSITFSVPASAMSDASPSRGHDLELHQQLVEGDAVAPSKLATRLLLPLIESVRRANLQSVPDEFVEEAVHLAIANLCKNPASFDASKMPGDQPLFSFLKMSAQGDLQNRLASEERHNRGRVCLDHVEQSPIAGKYLGRDDDPALPIEIQEEADRARREILPLVADGLTTIERECLELMLQNERRTSAYARAMRIEQEPKAAQAAKVKRMKDKLKKRIERGNHG